MKIKIIILSILLFICYSSRIAAQQNEHSFYLNDDEMILHINLKASKASIDSLLKVAGIYYISSNELIAGKYKKLQTEHWKINKVPNNILIVSRSLQKLSVMHGNNLLQILDQILRPEGIQETPGYPGIVKYGVNAEKTNIKELDNGETLFILNGFNNARKVILSGNFNNWSLSKTSMQKTATGWAVQMKLEPGKYYYKFIIDGNWYSDPLNSNTEPDGHGGKNSVYFKTNHSFILKGFPEAKKVTVLGNFNNWNEKELTLVKTNNVWSLPIYLQDGTHEYKFWVDNKLILDPQNPIKKANEKRNLVSVISIGNPTVFSLDGFPNARQVVLSGSFNNWDHNQLIMLKKGDKWILPYVLPPGNYEYKFIVDGNWIVDPSNKHQSGYGHEINSVIAVKPNHIFKLKGYEQAKTVRLAGTFNAWNESGYTLKYLNGEWLIPLHLPKGKHLYKFIVDDHWILDPGNKIYENNEYNTGNSVLWME